MPKPKSPSSEIVAAPQNDRPHRRRWPVEEKKRILDEAALCTERGQLAALLRKEGIYSAQLAQWRAQLDELVALLRPIGCPIRSRWAEKLEKAAR